MYQTYDVTGMIQAGDNALGAMLGEGWWSGLLSFGNYLESFRRPAVAAGEAGDHL